MECIKKGKAEKETPFIIGFYENDETVDEIKNDELGKLEKYLEKFLEKYEN